MKSEINPAVAAAVVVIAVILVGAVLYFRSGPEQGHFPSAQQAAQGHRIGGKILPSAVGAGGGK